MSKQTQSITTEEYLSAVSRLPAPEEYLKSERRLSICIKLPRRFEKPSFSNNPTEKLQSVDIVFDLVEFTGGFKWVYKGQIIHANGFWEIVG